MDLITLGEWNGHRITAHKHDGDFVNATAMAKANGKLFGRPFEKRPSQAHQTTIKRECRYQGITLTWHDWDDYRPNEVQRVLPL